MGKLIVLSGVSGSGKSTYARKLWNESGKYCAVFSADDYFQGPSGYCFNATKLSEAHGECFRNCIDELRQQSYMRYDLLIIDNTNTCVEEIAPYMLAASAFGWEAEVHTLVVNYLGSGTMLEKCAARNVHGVPFKAIEAQYRRICERRMPPYWKAIEVPITL